MVVIENNVVVVDADVARARGREIPPIEPQAYTAIVYSQLLLSHTPPTASKPIASADEQRAIHLNRSTARSPRSPPSLKCSVPESARQETKPHLCLSLRAHSHLLSARSSWRSGRYTHSSKASQGQFSSPFREIAPDLRTSSSQDERTLEQTPLLPLSLYTHTLTHTSRKGCQSDRSSARAWPAAARSSAAPASSACPSSDGALRIIGKVSADR